MTETPLSFDLLADAVRKRTAGRPYFVEIGAMDGKSYDLMYPHAITGAWDGLLVEPMPDMFAALRQNYEGVNGLTFDLCAVGEREGLLKMIRANPRLIQAGIFPPEYLGMTTSVRRDAFFQYGRLTPEQNTLVEQNLIEMDVACVTLPQLLEKHAVQKIDLLMIDTEGTDWAIAQQLDMERFKPAVICLEYAHFSEADKAACLAHYEAHGYAHAPCAVEDLNRLFFDPALLRESA